MSDPGNKAAALALSPSFWKTLRGVWSMSWRPWADWTRAPRWAWLLILPTMMWLTVENYSDEGFFNWFSFYVLFVTPLWCAVYCGAMIRSEAQADTMSFLLTRPQTRARLLTAKYLASVGLLQIALGLETALIIGVGVGKDISEAATLLGPVLATQALCLFAWCGLGTLFGLATSKHVLLAIVYGAVVEFGIGNIETNLNNLSLIRHLKTLLANNTAIADQFGWTPDGLWKAALILAVAPILTVFLSAIVFTVREFLHSAEIQK